MAYEVLARKWRPRQFEDVVGQEHVTRTLRHAVESGRVAHAYLFVGPRGIGKTSLARIFAKVLNCETAAPGASCDACDMCREVAEGRSLDVMEIDGASNNGVDQVRGLRDQVAFAPTRGRYRIFIIDEVHMLTTAAFNALLKTLEEPPPHVKFIFATTEGDKVLPTIISRCQRFDLRRIPTSLIVERLRMICGVEQITITEDALLAVARGAEGGLRDALSALDQLVSFKGGELTEEDVLAVFGLISRKSLEELTGFVLAGDAGGILRLIHNFDSAGKDLRRLVGELMDVFRNLLVHLNVGDAGRGVMDVTDEQLRGLASLGAGVESGRILRVLEHLADVEGRLRYALSSRTLLEIGLIRCSRAASTVTLDEVMRKLQTLRNGEVPAALNAPAGAEGTARPAKNFNADPVLKRVAEMFEGEVVD